MDMSLNKVTKPTIYLSLNYFLFQNSPIERNTTTTTTNNNNNYNNNNNNNKECEKRDKYLNLARELKKKLWNMKVSIIPIVIGAFGTVTKGLSKGLGDLEVGGRVETIQTTVLLKTARILRRVLETWGDFL